MRLYVYNAKRKDIDRGGAGESARGPSGAVGAAEGGGRGEWGGEWGVEAEKESKKEVKERVSRWSTVGRRRWSAQVSEISLRWLSKYLTNLASLLPPRRVKNASLISTVYFTRPSALWSFFQASRRRRKKEEPRVSIHIKFEKPIVPDYGGTWIKSPKGREREREKQWG
jgi:hypothetical protein